MPLPRRLEGCEIGLEVFELVGRIRPILPVCLPKRAQSLLMGNGVLDNHRANALRVGNRHAKADRTAIILHEQNVVRDAEPGGEFDHHARKVVESIFESRRGGRAAVTKAGIVGRDEVISIGQPGEERLEHSR